MTGAKIQAKSPRPTEEPESWGRLPALGGEPAPPACATPLTAFDLSPLWPASLKSHRVFGRHFGTVRRAAEAQPVGDLAHLVRDALSAYASTQGQAALRTQLRGLEQRLADLEQRLTEVEQATSKTVPIQTLTPFPMRLKREILAVVEGSAGNFLAAFHDAEVAACGDTESEAIYNLKDMLVTAYEIVTSHAEDKLAPPLQRQRRVLEEFLEPL